MNIGNLNRKKIGIVMAVLVAIILPITVFTLMRQQDTRSGASGSATLQLQPVQGSYNIGDQIQVAATISAGTNNVAYVKASFRFDKEKFKFVSFAKSNKFNEFLTNAAVTGIENDTVSFELINTDQAPNTGNIALGTLTFEALTAGTGDISFNPIEAYAAGDITQIQNPTEGVKATYTISNSTSTSNPTVVKNPATVSSISKTGAQAWVSPSNAKTSNNSYASVSFGALNTTGPTISQSLYARGFAFNIPTNATIQGIQVRVERKRNATAGIKDHQIALTKNGTTLHEIQPDDTAWGSTEIYKTYGGATALWGTTWTPAEINSANFGVHFALAATTGNAGAAVDHIEVGVYYTTNPTGDDCTILNDGRPVNCACTLDTQCDTNLTCQGVTGSETCQPRKPAGGTCTENTDCGTGLTCQGVTGAKTCQTPKTDGGTCTENTDCASPLTCQGTTGSKTCQTTTTTACPDKNRGDFNCDTYVWFDDLTIWAEERANPPADKKSDINGDGAINALDISPWVESRRENYKPKP